MSQDRTGYNPPPTIEKRTIRTNDRANLSLQRLNPYNCGKSLLDFNSPRRRYVPRMFEHKNPLIRNKEARSSDTLFSSLQTLVSFR